MRILQVRVLSLAPFILYLLYIKGTFTLKEDNLKAEFEVNLISVTTLVKFKVTFIFFGELTEWWVKAAVSVDHHDE